MLRHIVRSKPNSIGVYVIWFHYSKVECVAIWVGVWEGTRVLVAVAVQEGADS
jgi:hypothetical protein